MGIFWQILQNKIVFQTHNKNEKSKKSPAYGDIFHFSLILIILVVYYVNLEILS